MNHVEEILARHFNKRYCRFTGSGTAAIYLVLRALNCNSRYVLFPAITCASAVNAAIYAGYKPIFCDVNLDNYTIDLNSFKNVVKSYDVGVVVPTHIYGHSCDIQSIKNIVANDQVFILEDSAQTVKINDVNASIMSFGHTKILESPGGGGAIFTDDECLLEKFIQAKDTLPVKPINLENRITQYRQDYYSIMANEQHSQDVWSRIYQLQLKYKDAFLFDMDLNNLVLDRLNVLLQTVRARNERFKLYSRLLVKSNLRIPETEATDVIWRYSFLYTGNRDVLLAKVRECGIDISSWYPPVYKMYSRQDDWEFMNANYVGEHVVNLWIDPGKPIDQIEKEIVLINSFL